MKPILIVGQGPARSMADGAPALIGSDSFRRLAGYCETNPEHLAELADTVNVQERWIPTTGKYDTIHPALMAERGTEIKDMILHSSYRQIWLLGAAVWKSFNIRQAKPCALIYENFSWRSTILWACIPHPGGTNRWWNSEANRTLALGGLALLMEFAEDHISG